VRRALTACALCWLLPMTAAAQSGGSAPAPASQGPMIVERVHSGFLIAPDVKITEIDKKASGLVGGSAGWVADETIFIGGGGYWLAEKSRSDRQMAYGGLVVEWFVHNGDRFGFGAKGLFGGGRATLPGSVTQILPVLNPRDLDRLTPTQVNELLRTRTVTTTVRLREEFLVAEPELNARIGLAKHVRLTVGAGYRFTGRDRRGNDNQFRLNGATGSLGLQIGGGS
jgi:hypothetical protein